LELSNKFSPFQAIVTVQSESHFSTKLPEKRSRKKKARGLFSQRKKWRSYYKQELDNELSKFLSYISKLEPKIGFFVSKLQVILKAIEESLRYLSGKLDSSFEQNTAKYKKRLCDLCKVTTACEQLLNQLNDQSANSQVKLPNDQSQQTSKNVDPVTLFCDFANAPIEGKIIVCVDPLTETIQYHSTGKAQKFHISHMSSFSNSRIKHHDCVLFWPEDIGKNIMREYQEYWESKPWFARLFRRRSQRKRQLRIISEWVATDPSKTKRKFMSAHSQTHVKMGALASVLKELKAEKRPLSLFGKKSQLQTLVEIEIKKVKKANLEKKWPNNDYVDLFEQTRADKKKSSKPVVCCRAKSIKLFSSFSCGLFTPKKPSTYCEQQPDYGSLELLEFPSLPS
jgi:hypothetical protein